MQIHAWFGPAAVLGLALVPALQDSPPPPEVEMTEVAGGVSLLIGSGGNVAVFQGPDGLLMVDDQYEPMKDPIQDALDSLDAGELCYLVNTHHHGDHTGGNPWFGRFATVVAHHNVRSRLAAQNMVEAGLPVLTFGDELHVFFNGTEIRIRHFAHCHTDGDSVVYFDEAGVVHLGDLFFAGMFPFIDLASGGAVDPYIEAVAILVEELPEDVKIIPGHGSLSGKEDLRAFLDMLTTTRAHVKALKSEGMSLEEAQAAGLPEQYASWAHGYIDEARWIATLYPSA
jgi:glyoxylase-like metal-dependent hydrolase (beta-lactamase superfamily II)